MHVKMTFCHRSRVAFLSIKGRPQKFYLSRFHDSRAEGSFNRILMIFIARISTESQFDWHHDQIVNLKTRRLLKELFFFIFRKYTCSLNETKEIAWIIYEEKKKRTVS